MSISNFISNCVMTATIFLPSSFVFPCTHSESAMSALPWSLVRAMHEVNGSVCLFHLDCSLVYVVCVYCAVVYALHFGDANQSISDEMTINAVSHFHSILLIDGYKKIITLNDHIRFFSRLKIIHICLSSYQFDNWYYQNSFLLFNSMRKSETL